MQAEPKSRGCSLSMQPKAPALRSSRAHAAWRSGRGTIAADSREAKIDLLLERVHVRHLHLDFVAEANDAPRAPADEMIARRIEDIEVILHRRNRHQAAQAQVGHID